MLEAFSGKGQAVEDTIDVVSSPLPVFAEVNSNGQLTGYSVELARAILQQAGLRGEFRAMPLARVLLRMQKHPATLATAIARTPEREDKFYWITAITANPATLFIKASSSLNSHKEMALSDIKTVAVVRDDFREDILKENRVESIMRVSTWKQGVEAVLKERVEGLFFSQMGLALVCERSHLNCQSLVPVNVQKASLSYLALPKTAENQALATRLIEAAAQYKLSTGFQKLVAGALLQLKRFGLEVSERDGVLEIIGRYQVLKSEDLWVIADLAPYFAELNSRGEIEGYAARLVREILAEADLQQELLAAPWERILRESKNKPNVLAFAVARTAERENLFHWITPLTQNMHGLYGQENIRYKRLSEIPKEKLIAVLKQDYRSKLVQEAWLKRQEFESWNAATDAVLKGAVDYIFASDGAVQFSCQQMAIFCASIQLVMDFKRITTYLVVSKQGTNPLLVEKLRQAAVKVKHSDSYKQWSSVWSRDMNNEFAVPLHIENGVVKLWKSTE
ncbi:transporter substrate-binding domain-containing protein [Alteromonas pelagimontana]|uniref:Transporter substrate-binding domain-containing protein n=1 Tax=Alteromonas pelagimontana TaxID=1858656 RepID=A0A6M4MFK8_9ALTE|nr:transporter substrate-binding domain-containing protein [Alteromonas pelagimontana]QJR81405.1 transporter substrate-binding domain-containing protein [Alteromonas pelagimontana]